MTRQQRVDELELLQVSSAEEPFLSLDVVSYDRHQTATEGLNETYVAFLERRFVGFHKPFVGVKTANAYAYGHHPDEVPINECTAWGPPHAPAAPLSGIGPPTVLPEWGGMP